eukprot:5680899-Amphidinium_carterae.1
MQSPSLPRNCTKAVRHMAASRLGACSSQAPDGEPTLIASEQPLTHVPAGTTSEGAPLPMHPPETIESVGNAGQSLVRPCLSPNFYVAL